MQTQITPERACQEISGELRDIVRWLSGGGINPDEFRNAVAMLEARKLARFGFKLESKVSSARQVHFNLRFTETNELCASMDVNPTTGELVVQCTSV